MNGIDEALRYNGNLLDDGINVAGSDPLVQQFDGTINTQGIQTSYGIDVDQYDISALLSPGQTSGTTTYSAGADLVLLMAQIVSATSDPAVDLGVTMSHTGTFVSGGTGTYTITVSNAAGIEREDNTVTVTDTLPAGLTYNSATGTGWSCSAAGQVVTCTHRADAQPRRLVSAAVAGGERGRGGRGLGDQHRHREHAQLRTGHARTTPRPTSPRRSIRTSSTSTKTVVDLNGGEASPGDTLRYTITLTESAGGQARNVSLTDDVPDDVTFGGFVSMPAGATSSFTAAPAGANDNGIVNVSGITVPASGSVTVVFDVIVVAGTLPGTNINNTATLNNPNGAGEQSRRARRGGESLADPERRDEVRLPASHGGRRAVAVARRAHDGRHQRAGGERHARQLRPSRRRCRPAFTISANPIPVRLWLTRSSNNPAARNVTVTLTSSTGFSTSVNHQHHAAELDHHADAVQLQSAQHAWCAPSPRAPRSRSR